MSTAVRKSPRLHGPAPGADSGGYRARGALAAMAATLLACYGTLAAIAFLSAFGIALSPDQAIWKGTIVVLALSTTASVAAGWRRHRSPLPIAPAIAGSALMSYLMLVHFDRALEALAFLLLGLAVLADRHLGARAGCAARRGADR
jgi:hypothetical protein